MPDQRQSPTPAEFLARKIARIEWLAADNHADWRPSFVVLLDRCEPSASDWREAA